MTSFAKAYQVITFESQFWIFVIVLDMMYSCCFSLPAVSFALSAHISVSAQYRRTFGFPLRARVKVFHVFSLHCSYCRLRRGLKVNWNGSPPYRYITSDVVTAAGVEPTSRARCSCCDVRMWEASAVIEYRKEMLSRSGGMTRGSAYP